MMETGDYTRKFSERMRLFLLGRKLSASSLSREMGYTSRNSFFRVLNDECSYTIQREFYKRLCAVASLNLTPEEKAWLEEGLEVTRIGISRIAYHRAMTALVLEGETKPEEIHVTDEKTGQERSLMDCLRPIFETSGELYISQCICRPIYDVMEKLIRSCTADGAKPHIYHLIDASGPEAVRAMHAIQPVMYCSCYTGYTPKDGDLFQYCSGNWIIGAFKEDGMQNTVILAETADGEFCYSVLKGDELFQYERHVYQEKCRHMRAIKTIFARSGTPEDYIWLSEQYGKLEKNRELYDIRYDIPINAIPPEIIREALLDGSRQVGFGTEEIRAALVEAFVAVQAKRFENTFHKRRVTHTILSYAQMENFAVTGRHSDHFFAMRSYTHQERQTILRLMRDQTLNNPYFSLYFFRPGLEPINQEVGLYEGKGVLFTKGQTDYKLDGHAEAMIERSDFCQGFKDFFLNDLLPNRVVSKQQTLAYLDALLALC